MRRKSELESQLVRARGTDFLNPKTDSVTLGTKVVLTDLNSNNQETFTILGAWDSEPDQGVISYLTPMAQSILNKKIGDVVDFESDSAQKKYRIDSIVAAVTA
jgi:transcription elongation GreA/GreB family factor